MFDNITFVLPNHITMELVEKCPTPFEYLGLIFSPRYSGSDIKGYHASLDNLSLFLSFSGLTVSNSIHKYSKGNNYSDFTFQDVCVAIKTLEQKLRFKAQEAVLKKFEFACNIVFDAKDTYSRWLSYKGTTPQVMMKNNKVYGTKIYKTDYTIKGYDKSYETKVNARQNLDASIFRFELAVKNLRFINRTRGGLKLHTLADLVNVNNVQLLADKLIQMHRDIKKEAYIDNSSLSPEQTRFIAYCENPKATQIMKVNHPSTYKRDQKKYKELLVKCSNSSIDEQVALSIEDKLQYLIAH